MDKVRANTSMSLYDTEANIMYYLQRIRNESVLCVYVYICVAGRWLKPRFVLETNGRGKPKKRKKIGRHLIYGMYYTFPGPNLLLALI